MKKTLITTLIIFYACFFAFAQNGHLQFTNYTIDNGLSGSVVNSVYVEENGIEWIGTFDGLNSFDGFEYEVYKPHKNNPYSLSAPNIIAMYLEDSKNNLWMLTGDGLLNKFNLKTKLCENYGNEFIDSLGFKQSRKRGLVEDSNSDIWITNRNGLYKYKRAENELIRYSSDCQNSASLSNNSTWITFQDSKNRTWIGTAWN